ncbi:MAG: PD40 domain-containing protein [Calditrichae bacterium]|nr:PD40 domain-containing protein [Calditrichia bacterium]
MKYWKSVLLFLALLVVIQPQEMYGFGKNKVRYKSFTWKYIQSTHFDIYFYEGGQDIAEFAAAPAETAYVQLRRDFKFEIRERIVFILYNSHHDFRQTNVIDPSYNEFTKGVTELFKNRITLPFEGDYEAFRHVIHHELVHAVMNDLLYGGSVQSLIAGEVVQPPLWVSEGLAEFQSVGWNTDMDMMVRDAVLNNYIPDMNLLQYYMVYQGGASVFRYIADTYGREKIGEILHKTRGKVSFERVMKSSLGVGYREFTDRWHRYLKKQYWPDVADRKEPVEIAKQLTHHARESNSYNYAPTLSPNGDKIAYIADEDGYINIYLMSALDGKMIKTLVQGDRSEDLEEIHLLRPGMSFSPDSKKLAFAAKSGPTDALSIVDIKSGDVQQFELDLEGIYTTAWSPDGDQIAFVGVYHGQSDIYLFNLKSETLSKVTDDIFSDDVPSWSADGKKLVFISDRRHYLDKSQIPADFKIHRNYDYETRDIYVAELGTGALERITDTPWEEENPLFSPDGQSIAFISDQNGIRNIFMYKLDTGETYPITDVITGIMHMSWDRSANKMAFSALYQGGFDIYLMTNPLERPAVELRDTQYRLEMREELLPVYARNWKPEADETPEGDDKLKGASPADYRNFVFGRQQINKPDSEEQKPVALNENVYQDDEGNYKVRRYKLKFSPDVVTGSAGYNTFFGFAGYTTFLFSDLLGDHKILLDVNLLSDLKNSGLNLLYLYLKKRINIGIGGYHQAYFFSQFGSDFQRYRNYGLTFLASYPFSKFNRMEFNLNWYNISLEYLNFDLPDQKVSTILPSLSYVHDNTQWGYTGPIAGSRYALNLLASPKYNDNSLDFRTVFADYRKYLKLNREYSFAWRLSGAASFGDNPQRFFLGGIDNWINYKSRGRLRTDLDDVFFSSFVTPLRGAYYYEGEGSRYLLSNLEFRFPLIQFLGLGFPPIRLFNIRGSLFYDIGTAFDPGENWYSNSKWRGTYINENGQRAFKDLVSGYGVGARVFFLYFLMRFDVAWNYDLAGSSKPIWYISLGGDF